VIGNSLYGDESASVPVVIVHPGVAIQSLSSNEARAIFAMRRRTWPNGTPIQVFVLPDDHPLHRAFCKKILNIYPHQLRRIWDRGVFSGTGQAPVEVETLEEMQKRISSVEGAIGYWDGTPLSAAVKAVTTR
jgi:ABC-type phosphate transport system substrate-binding protein